MSFVIRLQKENFKFSGSHFTIFSETTAERLHGHNYYVSVDVETEALDPKTGITFDFNDLKPNIKHLCDGLDEFVLIPQNSPFLHIQKQEGEIEVKFANKRYVFPEDDVCLLPVVNVSSEELAKYFANQICAQLPKHFKANALAVNIRETQGQSVTYTTKLNF